VHNAPAGQVAIRLQATGPNITMTGGDASFEQALLAAHLLALTDAGRLLVLGADELHPVFSRVFDPSVALDAVPSDGGGALVLRRASRGRGPILTPGWFGPGARPGAVAQLVEHQGGAAGIRERYGAVLAGIPAAHRETGQRCLVEFLALTGFGGPVVDYRRYTGEFASASAVAAVWAQAWVRRGSLPPALCGDLPPELGGRGVLLLGLGAWLTACAVQDGGAP
jgi:3-oxoacyl-[acyl-carrier-protein] synthase-1/3-oxoacyl-[acyl-carrier-protein] synthase II